MTTEKTNPEIFYCYHLVAFLDLLGQKDKLREIEGILDAGLPDADKQTLRRVLKETVGTVRSFRNSFTEFFNQSLSYRSELQIPKEFENLFYQLRGRAKINLQSFSDSTIAWAPVQLKNEIDYAQVLNSIHGILAAVGMMTPFYLSKKIPFRGGIDLEGGIRLGPEGNEIYGPALNRAYFLESTKAKYPRVLIGPGVLEFLDHISSVNFQNKVVKRSCEAMSEQCKGWIVVDNDGQSMVHFLGRSAIETAKYMPDYPNFYRQWLEPLGAFVDESIERYKADKELKNRYQRLKAYFDKYIGDWQR